VAIGHADELEPGWYWADFRDWRAGGEQHGDWEVVRIQAGYLYRVAQPGRPAKYYRNMDFIKIERPK
jgi:hypothetical protein